MPSYAERCRIPTIDTARASRGWHRSCSFSSLGDNDSPKLIASPVARKSHPSAVRIQPRVFPAFGIASLRILGIGLLSEIHLYRGVGSGKSRVQTRGFLFACNYLLCGWLSLKRPPHDRRFFSLTVPARALARPR